jgi:hypothetical protein
MCVAIGIGMVGVELLRMWSSRPLNSIWAEDGATWLADAIHRGFFDALTTPYDGYLQTSSRIMGTAVAALPIGLFAAGMAIGGAALVAGCAFLVWRASAGHVRDPVLRGMLAALVILLPIADVELLANVTNSIWFVLFVGFWVLLWRPATLTRAVLAAAVLLLAAISNIGVIALTPVWVLRFLAIRDRRDGVIVTAFGIGVALQLGLSANELNMSGEAGTLQGSLTPHWDWALIPAYLQRIAGGAVFGNNVTGFLWENLGIALEVLSAAILASLVVLAARGRSAAARLLVPLAIAISLGLFLGTGYQRWESGGSQFLWPHGSFTNHFSRYMVVPLLLFLSAVFIEMGAPTSSALRATRTGPRRLTGALIVSAALVSFNAADANLRGRPTWSAAVRAARSLCRRPNVSSVPVPVAPTVITGAFTLPLSCRALGRG